RPTQRERVAREAGVVAFDGRVDGRGEGRGVAACVTGGVRVERADHREPGDDAAPEDLPDAGAGVAGRDAQAVDPAAVLAADLVPGEEPADVDEGDAGRDRGRQERPVEA